MSIEDLVTLESFAAKCRQGLETLAKKDVAMFEGFPKGACGIASELLGRLLQEHLGLQGVYVCGCSHPELPSLTHSHAWVEVADWIVDITHDQFSGTDIDGWVVPLSSAWHGRFRSVERRQNFSMPSGWPAYPYEGYLAMRRTLEDGEKA